MDVFGIIGDLDFGIDIFLPIPYELNYGLGHQQGEIFILHQNVFGTQEFKNVIPAKVCKTTE